jgi:hypothetical protein
MSASPVASLVRAWVDLYTRGLPETARAARRDEVDDDLWCQHEEATAIRRSTTSLNAEILIRLLFGMPADVSWRIASGQGGPELERHPSAGARVLGILAIVGVVGWGAAIGGYVAWGADAWLTAGLLMYITQLVGGLAFAGATIGLAFRFQERLSAFGVLTGVLGGVAALFGVAGAYQLFLFLPIGTAVLAWDLGRARVLSRPLAVAHSVGGLLTIPLLVGFVAGLDTTLLGVGYLSLMLPYLGSWLGIGVWLIRGVPADREPDEAHHRPP